jgi:hypothetical protein
MLKRYNIFIILVFLSFPVNLFGGENWKQLKTKYTVVFYRDGNALEEFERKLKMGVVSGLFMISEESKDLSITLLQRKIDRIFERDQELLNVSNTMNRINIILHATQKEVAQAYLDISKKYKMDPSGHQKHIAFYVHNEKTVYVSLEKVTEGVLAHEFGHAILDHHLIVPPPRVVGELVARYLERNLKRW